MKKVIIGGVAALVVLLVIGGTVVGTLYATGKLGAQPPAAAPGDAAAPPALPGDVSYVPLEPAFTLSFQEPTIAQFLQINIELAVQDKATEDAVKMHGPAIRNGLVMLLSGQRAEDLRSRDGKERLRLQVRDEVRDILTRLTGKAGVADAYFTTFLMQ